MPAAELGDGKIEPTADFPRIHRHQPFQARQRRPAFARIHQKVGQLQKQLGIVRAKLQFRPEPVTRRRQIARAGS